MLFFAFLVFVAQALSQQAKQPGKNPTLGDNQQQAKDKKEECKNKKTDSPNPMPMLPIDDRRPGDGIKEKAQRATQDAHDSPRTWRNIFKDPTSVFTGTLALFTVFLVLVGIRQVWISRNTEIRQLRAYVFVTRLDIGNIGGPPPTIAGGGPIPGGPWIYKPDSGPIVTMTFKNSGQTPAYNMTCHSNLRLGEYPPVPALFKFKETPSPTSKTPIPPGGIAQQAINKKLPISPEGVQKLNAGVAAIYFYGAIVYIDAFGKQRRTNFRHFYNNSAEMAGIEGAMTACDEGNEAD